MAKYPVIAVGDLVTADLLGSMLPDWYYKSVTTTRASTVALADDPDLLVPSVPAAGTFLIEFYIKHASVALPATAGIKTAWNVPAGASGLKSITGSGSTQNDASADNVASRWGVHAFTTAIAYGSRLAVANQQWAYEWAVVIMGGTAGNIALQWAQNTSNVTGSTVNSGSYAKSTRIA